MLVLVKCNDPDSDTDKWYFRIKGEETSNSAVELGVAPPPDSKIAGVRYIAPRLLGFRLVFQTDDGAEESWYYATICPASSGKDFKNLFTGDDAKQIMESKDE